MKLHPDPSRFGWRFGVLFQETSNNKRQASGIYFEPIGEADPTGVAGRLAEAGFVPATQVGSSPFRLESNRINFNTRDLASWFPGFDAEIDMSSGAVNLFMVEQPPTVMTSWFFDFNWPRQEDLDAVDSSLQLHGWEYPVDAWERVAAERVLRISAKGDIVDPELATERMLDLLYGADELQKRRPALAERMLGRIAAQTHEALKSASVVAIERLGSKVLMPPLRVFREGEAITTAFADHRRIVESAIPDYQIPDEAIRTYRPEWVDPAKSVEVDLAVELDVLKSYPEHETVDEWYDRDDAFSDALVRLIPGFEYPDWSHRTIGEVLGILAKRNAPEITDPPAPLSPKIMSEIENLRQINVVSQRLGLEFDIASMASTALRESGHLNEVFETTDTLAEPGIRALQMALEEAGVFSEQHMALSEILQTEVRKDAQMALDTGEMPVYRTTDLMCVAIHPSARQEGMVQATRYATDGVIGDSQYNTLEEAVRSEGLWFVPRLPSDEAKLVLSHSIKAEAEFQDWKTKAVAKVAAVEPTVVEVDVVTNPKVRRPRKTKPKVEDRIEDVGEKIGGARKDFYKNALSVADLPTMNDLEKNELVRKANIWPWSVKDSLGAGVEPCVVQWVKTLRRHIREFGDTSRYAPKQDAATYIRGIETLRDAIGNPKTKAELTNNLQAFRLRLYEEGQWVPFRHPVTGEKIGFSRHYQDSIEPEVHAVGQRAFDMADNRLTSSTSSALPPEFTPEQWHSSKAQCYEDNREYALSKLMPARRTVVKTETDIVMPERPHLASLVQSGFGDARSGRDVEATELLSKFGFRAIEFGNWVPQDERQAVINLAYDGMHALCETLGVESKMASLHGELALAFGARGRGGKSAAMAHYEPSRKVINLTRIKGAGSLMHEWKHAFDNHLGEMFTGAPGVFLSDRDLDSFVARKSAVEMKAEGIKPDTIERSLSSGYIFPTPVWRETAISMAAVVRAMTRREKTVEVVRQEAAELGAVRVDWATSWIRNDLVAYFRDKAGDDQGVRVAASTVGEAVAKEIVAKAIADHSKLTYVYGHWKAFDNDIVFEQVKAELRSDYKIKLSSKAATNMERCLNTASKNLGLVQMMNLSPDEKAAYEAQHPRSPSSPKIFDLPKVMTDASFMLEAKKLDKSRSKPYWSTTLELLARAGEQSMFYAIQENGCQADYLVHGVEETRYAGETVTGNPYPVGDERRAIAVAMKSLLDNGCQLIRERALELEQKAKPGMGMAA